MPDLRGLLNSLERTGELLRIEPAVDPSLEIAEITNRISKRPGGGKALLFRNVAGSRFPVVTNLYGSPSRLCAALGIESLAALKERTDALVRCGRAFGMHSELDRFRPRVQSGGPCQEIVEDAPDLSEYPLLKAWPGDGLPDGTGRFLTLPAVFTADPDTGEPNCGIYLVEELFKDRLGIGWHPGKGGAVHLQKWSRRGLPMPVAIALGVEAALLVSAAAPLPEGLDEVRLAGYLQGKPLEMTRCRSHRLLVPASAEIVIEGFVDPEEREVGGQYCNHTGYYVPSRMVPVMRISCITRRRTPFLPATVIGPPPMEDCHMAQAVGRIMLSFLQEELPEVEEIDQPLSGIFHGAAIVRIRNQGRMPGAELLRQLWHTRWLKNSALLVLVDADLTAEDSGRLLHAILNNVDWQRDVQIFSGKGESPFPFGGGIGIDARRKAAAELPTGRVRERGAMDEAVRRLVSERWREYGFNDEN